MNLFKNWPPFPHLAPLKIYLTPLPQNLSPLEGEGRNYALSIKKLLKENVFCQLNS